MDAKISPRKAASTDPTRATPELKEDLHARRLEDLVDSSTIQGQLQEESDLEEARRAGWEAVRSRRTRRIRTEEAWPSLAQVQLEAEEGFHENQDEKDPEVSPAREDWGMLGRQ